MGVCSSKLNESDVKWLTIDNNGKRSSDGGTAMKPEAKSQRGSRRTKQTKRSGDKSLHARSKNASAGDPKGASPVSAVATANRDNSTKIISPTPQKPISIQELSTPLDDGQAGSRNVPLAPNGVEAGGVKLDFSVSMSHEPSRGAKSVGDDFESADDRELGNAANIDIGKSNSKFVAIDVAGNIEVEVDGTGEDDDDAATLMSVARGVDSHEHDREPGSQAAADHEWSSLHDHPQRDFKPLHFDHPSIDGSLGGDLPPSGDITIVYQSNVAKSNMTPPAPPTASLHYPGIGKSPFRKRINLFEMWNEAQPNTTSVDRQPPLPLATAKRDSHESDRISRYTFKQRYEHVITGGSSAKHTLQKSTNKNDFDKENESFPANITAARSNNIALSAMSTPPRSKIDPLRSADCTPPRRPCNPHGGQVEKFGAYPLALAARAHPAKSDDDCSWISKLQDHHSMASE